MAPRRNTNAKASPSLTKRPQFFRVLIPSPFVKLHIPQNFMKYLNGEQYKKATLLSPRGKFWHINLHQEGNDLFMDGGWSDFAKEHDLCTGYFVVFRYEGNMVFTVKVFDETCCLKDYELASCESTDHSSTSNESSEVDCLTLSRSSEHEDELQCNSTPLSKKRKLVEISKGRTTPPAMKLSKNTQQTSSSSPTPNKRTKRTPPISSTRPIMKTKSISPGLATRSIKKTQKRSISSNSLPQFEKIVRPSNYMSFPKKFCIQNGLTSKEEIFLKNLEGKSYSARLYKRLTEIRLGKGWKDFASENGVKDGDTCIFKLITDSTVLVCVKNAQGEIKGCTDFSEKNANNCEGAIQYPQFEKIVRPFNLGLGYFTIPRSFCLVNGLVSKRNVMLEDSDGKQWQVGFLIREDKAKLQKGWSKFSKAHDLQVGQKCVFTLVNENTFRVIVEKKHAETEA